MSIISIINNTQERCGFIKNLSLFRDINNTNYERFDLELVLVAYPNTNDDELKIIFEGICDLRFGNICDMFKIIIDIEDISSYQIEDIHYKVSELENSMFSFSCKDIRLKK